jgi:hypothetical protein
MIKKALVRDRLNKWIITYEEAVARPITHQDLFNNARSIYEYLKNDQEGIMVNIKFEQFLEAMKYGFEIAPVKSFMR